MITTEAIYSASNGGMEMLSHTFKTGVRAISDAAGHVFNALAAVRDDTSTLSQALQGVRLTASAVRYAQEQAGERNSRPSFLKSIDKSIKVIDMTRMFSFAHYLFSGDCIEDLKQWNFGAALSQISFAAANSIHAYMSSDEMIKVASDIEIPQDDTRELVKNIGSGFLIGGYLGEIGQCICNLVKNGVGNAQIWLDLIAAVAGVAVPILMCCGVTLVPVLVAFGLLSCVTGITSAIYAHYHKQKAQDGLSPNFAGNTFGLGTALGPVTPLANTLEGTLDVKPLADLSANVQSYGDLTAALSVFNRGKDWFYSNNKGVRSWEHASVWDMSSRILGTISSGIGLASWLGSVKAIDGGFKNLKLFKAFRSALSITIFSCNAIDNGVNLHKMLPKWKAKNLKMHKWKVLANALQIESVAAIDPQPTIEQWNRLRDELILQYNHKIQAEIVRNGPRANQEDSYYTALRDALANGETAQYLSLKTPATRLSRDDALRARANDIQDGAQRSQLERDLLSSKKRETLQARGQALGTSSVARFVAHKKALSAWKYQKKDIQKMNLAWKIAADVFRIAAAVASLVTIFFTGLLGLLPQILWLGSALVNGGRYFAEAYFKVEVKP